MNGKLFTVRYTYFDKISIWWTLLIFYFLPTHLVQSQQALCSGSIGHYAVDTAENGGLGTTGAIYLWSVEGTGFSGNINQVNVSSTNAVTIDWNDSPPGNYTINVTEMYGGCIGDIQSLSVNIRALPEMNLKDKIACIDPVTGAWPLQTYLNTGLPLGEYSFNWYLENNLLPEHTSFITLSQPGSYKVEITNLTTGCQSVQTAVVTASSVPIATVTAESGPGQAGHIQVTVQGNTEFYEFSLNGGPFQDSPDFFVDTPGYYEVTVRDKYQCGQVVLPVHVIGFMKYFTPNGDSYHDTWNIIGLPNSAQAEIYIFDRYGKLLKQIKSGQPGWDGTFNGYSLPAEDYWFTLQYHDKNGIKREFRSHMALKR